MKIAIPVIIVALLLSVLAFGQTFTTETKTALAYVPDSAADVVTRSVTVTKIYLANKSAAAVTVTIITKTGSLQAWPAISVPANTVMIAQPDLRFEGGVNWVASAASAVLGSITYRE